MAHKNSDRRLLIASALLHAAAPALAADDEKPTIAYPALRRHVPVASLAEKGILDMLEAYGLVYHAPKSALSWMSMKILKAKTLMSLSRCRL